VIPEEELEDRGPEDEDVDADARGELKMTDLQPSGLPESGPPSTQATSFGVQDSRISARASASPKLE
jgi:hypothetical protein